MDDVATANHPVIHRGNLHLLELNIYGTGVRARYVYVLFSRHVGLVDFRFSVHHDGVTPWSASRCADISSNAEHRVGQSETSVTTHD